MFLLYMVILYIITYNKYINLKKTESKHVTMSMNMVCYTVYPLTYPEML